MSIEIDWKLVTRLSSKTNHMTQRAQKAEAVGQTGAARANWDRARRLAARAAEIMRYSDSEPQRSNTFVAAATTAFKCGRIEEARGFIESGMAGLSAATAVSAPYDTAPAVDPTLLHRATQFHKLMQAVRHAELTVGAGPCACPSTGTEAGPTQVDGAAKCA